MSNVCTACGGNKCIHNFVVRHGEKPFGRWRCRWKDNHEMDFMKISC